MWQCFAENNISRDCTAEQVGNNTSDKQSRNRSRCEEWQDGQCFRNTNLYFTETERCKDDRQHDIDRRDHSDLG